jgi:hypothetical protein
VLLWLASYPRSGNTFLRLVLKAVFGMGSYTAYREAFTQGALQEGVNTDPRRLACLLTDIA